MNYIKKLEAQVAELQGELDSAYRETCSLRDYAMSPKFMGEPGFGGPTYINKQDVINRAEVILGEMTSVVLRDEFVLRDQ
tara:strand:+ start:352 stop:591 length:240 start_codon:yes stop_codon:yes gene_type:complete